MEILDAHPLSKVLTSMPGIGVRTGASILFELGDGAAFPTPGHLAAYAGVTTRHPTVGHLDPWRASQPRRTKS